MFTEFLSLELALALLGFSFATSITPGPNNLMLMSSGANFGIRRTFPHMLGVSLGHSLLVFMFGIGLSDLFEAFPDLRQILTFVCSVYLLWLAWVLANAAPPPTGQADGVAEKKPLTFIQAALFQWVNPKGIYMAITAQTYYAPDGMGWIGALYVALGFASINFPCISAWVWFGVQMKRFLGTGRRLRLFNIAMGLLLVATLIPILSEAF